MQKITRLVKEESAWTAKYQTAFTPKIQKFEKLVP